MNYIDVKNFRKYEQLFGDNGPAKIGHVNAVIKALNEATSSVVSSIIPGTNITITPVSGTGAVTINAAGGGLGGTHYVFVMADGTDTENATQLQDAYTQAAGLVSSSSVWVSFGIYGAMDYGGGNYEVYFNPNTDFFQASTTYSLKINGVEYTGTTAFASSSSAYFSTNAPAGLTITSFEALDVVTQRATVIAAPGYYNFGGSTFLMDQEYVDLISLDGNRSVIFNAPGTNFTAILVTANDTYIRGIDVQGKTISAESTQGKNIFENCKALGTFSFGEVDSTGTYINCEGGAQAFGSNWNASGTYIDCTAGVQSFGSYYTASGTFIRCTGTDSCFGYTSSGTFIDCTGGFGCFGSSGYATGTYKNCVAGNESFGGGFGIGTASGTFINCVGGSNSFGAIASGTFKDCTAEHHSFGCFGTASGSFIGCRAGQDSSQESWSFGGGNFANGYFENCVCTGRYGFGGGGGYASGTFINCISSGGTFGNNSFGSGGNTSGVFHNCIAGLYSFGGSLTGKLYYCRLTSGTFPTIGSGGKVLYCVDGNNDPNNQGFTVQNKV